MHGTVRDPSSPKNEHWSKLKMGTLTLFELDLTHLVGFDKATEGCEIVICVTAVDKQNFN